MQIQFKCQTGYAAVKMGGRDEHLIALNPVLRENFLNLVNYINIGLQDAPAESEKFTVNPAMTHTIPDLSIPYYLLGTDYAKRRFLFDAASECPGLNPMTVMVCGLTLNRAWPAVMTGRNGITLNVNEADVVYETDRGRKHRHF